MAYQKLRSCGNGYYQPRWQSIDAAADMQQCQAEAVQPVGLSSSSAVSHSAVSLAELSSPQCLAVQWTATHKLMNELGKGNWSSLWQLPFILHKCHVLQIGLGNPKRTYAMMGRPLKATESERDLGIIVNGQLNFHQQTAAVVSKANKILSSQEAFL